MIVLVGIAACATPAPEAPTAAAEPAAEEEAPAKDAAPKEEPEAEAPKTAPEPTPDAPPAATKKPGGEGGVRLSATTVKARQPLTVTFDRPGPNGCYRQSAATLSVEAKQFTHAYKTWTEGEMCTQAMVPGGFNVDVTPYAPGVWTGRILVNDEEVATYTFTATDP